MATQDTAQNQNLDKIVNPGLARLALMKADPRGVFEAIVDVISSDYSFNRASGVTYLSPGKFRATIPCGEVKSLQLDAKVLNIELLEYGSQR